MSTIKNLHNINEDNAIQKEIDESAKYQASLIKKAIAIAKRSRGNFDRAYDRIEKMSKGLGDNPMVAKALKTANEGVEQNSDLDTMFEEALTEAPTKITSVRAKKGQYVFGKDEKKDISAVTYKGKVISTGDFDSGSDSWWMNIKGKKGQVSFDQPKDVVDYFTKNKITESVELDEANFSKSQIDKLRKEFGNKKTINTGSPAFRAVVKSFRKLPDNALEQIRDAKIPHISFLAANIIQEKKRGKGNYKFPGSTAETVEYETDLDSLFEEELKEDYFNVQYYDKKGKAVKGGKTFKTKPEADKYAKRGNSVDRVGGTYKVLAVKGRMESVEEKVELEEGSISGVTKALGNLAKKPEYKKIANALNGLANPVNMAPKKQASAINRRLKQLATKVDKKAGAKLLRIADLASTYESVELDEVKKGQVFSKKEAEAYFKKQYGSKFNAKKMGTETDDKGVKYWMDKGHSGEAVPMKEEVELDEGVSLTKKGDYELTADGKSSVGVRLSLRYKGKQIVTGVKKDGMFVMAFEKIDGNNKLPKGAKEIKRGKWVHIGFKKADDVIEYARFGDITETTKLFLEGSGSYVAYSSGSVAFLTFEDEVISSGEINEDNYVFGFKHKDIHHNARFQPAGMVKKGKDFTHIGFENINEVIDFAREHKITEDIRLDEVKR